jgi:hypothetical protein
MEQQVVANELNNQSLTFGQKLVDVNFNPSGNPTIDEVKQLCARLADIVWENSKGRDVSEPYMFFQIRDHSISTILNAQMNIVKLLTFKH